MTIYLLINEQDTDAVWGSNVEIFTDKQVAQDAMRDSWQATVDAWEYNTKEHQDEDECECGEDTAVIRDGNDYEYWRIEEKPLDVQVAVRVKDGLVRSIYANTDVGADVYDMDLSEFPDEDELKDADKKQAELDALIKSPGWRPVW